MAFLLSVSLLLTYLNYRGLNVVGQTAMTTTLFIITPFVLLCLLAAPHVEPSNWLQVRTLAAVFEATHGWVGSLFLFYSCTAAVWDQ